MLQVATTVDSEPAAQRIAAALVERGLAACVQVAGPITSVYRWRGRVETSREWLCTAKTVADRWDAIRSLIDEVHPYDTPELIATPIERASPAYEEWLRDACGG